VKIEEILVKYHWLSRSEQALLMLLYPLMTEDEQQTYLESLDRENLLRKR